MKSPRTRKRILLLIISMVIPMAMIVRWGLAPPDKPKNASRPVPDKLTRQQEPVARGAGSQPLAPPAAQHEAEQVPSAEEASFDWARITAFHDWAGRYLASPPEERPAMTAEGLRLARARRPEFKKLIALDPQRALEQAVRPVVRQELPAEITRELEQPVSARGDYKVYLGRPAPGIEIAGRDLVLRYFETAQGASYRAHVFGENSAVLTAEDVAIRGVAIDRDLAVAPSAVRALDAGERIAPGAVVEDMCPVSGKTTVVEGGVTEPITDETPAIELELKIIRLCDGSHVRVLDEKYRLGAQRAASGGPGGAQPIRDNFPGTSAEAIGNFRALYIRVAYPDRLVAPNTEASALEDMRNVARFYSESSFGRLSVSTAFTPLIVLPHTREWYEAKDEEVDGLGLVHGDSRSEARRFGFDSGQYDVIIVRVSGGPRLSGVSWGGGDNVWVSWDGMDVLNHECGHSLGRPHANFWNTGGQSAIGPGANQEYGNSFDVMGGGSGFTAHYNSISKRALGWLPAPNTHNPAAGGVYRIFAYDQPVLEEGKRYGLRVSKDSTRAYNVEFHDNYGIEHPSRVELRNSALLLWSGFGGAGHLLDTTPGTPAGKDDSGVEVGRTFSDPGAALHLTVLERNATTPASLDVALHLGNDPANQAPTLELNASTTNILLNGTATFTANASDPDGDPLAYHWDCGDGLPGTNSATFTRAFTVARQLTIHCTVSDMKGGVTRGHVVVTVGGSARRAVTGRITAAGEPVQGVLVTGGGRYAYTDTQGFYALSDLPTGAATLTPLLHGFSFAPNPGNINVSSGANILNFIATVLPVVTISSTAPAGEPATAGAFAILRTGPVDGPLPVRVMSAAGTAERTVDFNFSPNYVDDGNYRTFEIPAGAAALNIAVVPSDDTLSEGPETVELQLAEGTNYVVGAEGLAILTLQDDDTTLPQVRLTAADTEASEAPGNIAAWTISRTGGTEANLDVGLMYGGTATRGVDYPALPTTITLPSGQESVTVFMAPLNDDLVEGSETATVTLGSGAAYVLDAGATSAELLILDEDIPILGVVAVDPNASEAGRDPAVFLITRTGKTAAPLKVYYGLAGNALHGTDYIQLPVEVTIPAGAASAPVLITPYDDVHGEGEETVTLRLTVFNGSYLVGPSSSASATISDNDDPGLVTVDSVSSTAAEPADAGRFRFHLTGSRAQSTTVRYSVSGTAQPGADYGALPGVVLLPAPINGESEVEVDVTPVDDALKEDVEGVVVRLLPDPAYVIYNSGSATVLLRDNDQPTLNVEAHSDTPSEPSTASEFYISRTGANYAELTAGALPVTFTLSGTAQNGVDYQSIALSTVIPDGMAGVNIVVTPLDDGLLEGTETVTLTLNPSVDFSIGADSDTLYLADNEAHTISVGFQAASSTTSEAPDAGSGEYRSLRVILSALSPNLITAEYVVAAATTAWADGIDWSLVDAGNAPIHRGLLTFQPGVTNQDVRLRIVPDDVIEGSETAVIEIRNVHNGRPSTSRGIHTLTILDNTSAHALPRLQFIIPAATVAEGAGNAPLLIAALDRPATTTVTAAYGVGGGTATAGVDFTLAPGVLTLAPGETSKAIPLAIINDAIVESDETVIVGLSAPAGAQLGAVAAQTVTIRDNDSDVPVVSVAASGPSATEDGQTARFTFSRQSGGMAQPLTVHYVVRGSAAPGLDYVPLDGSVTIPAGQVEAHISLTALDDPEAEPNETVTLTIAPHPAYVLGQSVSATALILDDESRGQPPSAFSQSVFAPRNRATPIALRGSDPSGDSLSYQIVTLPARGALTGSGPNVTYTSGGAYVGPDSFTFRVTDGATTSSVATVSLTVYLADLVASNSVWRYNDAGTDLGSAWRGASYNDANWSNGVARLGFGGDGEATRIRGQPVITYYFRQRFTVADGLTYSSLNLRLQRDDGVIAYLNGTEIARDNMPGGAAAYSTRASTAIGDADETAWLNFGVNPALLQTGQNLVCAEVHQFNASSSDIGFALELTGVASPPTGLGPSVTLAATDPEATEPVDSATFTVTRLEEDLGEDLTVAYVVSGTATPGADYEVPSGILTIPAGASEASLVIRPLEDYESESPETVVVTLAAGLGYRLETDITAGIVIADDDGSRQPPVAQPQTVAVAMNTPAGVNLVAIDPEDDPLFYEIVTPPGSGTLSGTPPNLLYAPSAGFLGPDAFTFRANDGGLWSAPALVSLEVFDPAVLISSSALWRYHDGGVDLGTAWRAAAYNDSSWSSGSARLGFGGDGELTTLRGQPVVTYYFRKAFAVPAGYTVTNAMISLQRDDGVVVYLDGAELLRDNMPGGTISYSTRAGANASDETTWLDFPVSASLLAPGMHLLAAEVHQINDTSSDAGFNLTLRGDGEFNAPAPPPTLAIERVLPEGIRIWFPAPDGLSYAVEASVDLEEWGSIGTNTSAGGVFEFTTQSTDPAARFFRVRPAP